MRSWYLGILFLVGCRICSVTTVAVGLQPLNLTMPGLLPAENNIIFRVGECAEQQAEAVL